MANEIDYRNIRIDKITVLNGINDIVLFDHNDTEGGPSSTIEKIIIEEDMFSSVLTGKLVINDNSAIIEQLKLSGWESVIIDVTWLETEDETIIETPKRYELGITEVEVSDNLVEKKASGPAGNKVTAILTLVSDLFTVDNISSLLQEDFLGKIAKGNTKYSDPEENKLDGYVDKLAEKLPTVIEVKKEWKIDGTDNEIWVKKEPNMYPWFKTSTNPKFLEMMNYIIEYACDAKNKNAVNFLFWEDLQYVNFRSIESLLREQKEPVVKYVGYISDAEKWALLNLNIISDFNSLKLLYTGALFGEYMRVVPDWKNPYYGFLDPSDKFKREWITWNYAKKTDTQKLADWLKIEQYDPVAEDLLEDIKYLPSYNANRLVDSMYGYYDTSIYNSSKQTNWWDFWDPTWNGYTGEKNFINNFNLQRKHLDKRSMFTNDPSLLKPDRLSDVMWQAQFDMIDLPITKLKTIFTKIKWPLTFNRFKYAEAKKIKLKWDIWKQKICCEKQVPSTFFAIITDATKIFGATGTTGGIPCKDQGDYFDNASIWAYNWTQVEMWPASEVESLKGKTLMYFYFFDKDNRTGDPSLKYTPGRVENTNHKFPFVFVVPPAGLSGTVVTKKITNPLLPTPITWTSDTRAYNLRELLNSNFYGFTAGEKYASTMLGTAVSAFGKLSEADRTVITNYPEHYSMLPVGKFLLAKEHTQNINFSSPYIKFGNSPGATGSTGDFYFHGALVQMYAIPATGLKGISLSGVQADMKIQDENYDPIKNIISKTTINKRGSVKYAKNDYLFVFDAPNNHAGICKCLETS